jgi:hypothetical protein
MSVMIISRCVIADPRGPVRRRMPTTALMRRAYHRPERPTNVRSGRNILLEGTITPAAVTPSGAGPTDLGSIAATWLGERPTRLESLGSGGLSGAPVVRVGRAGGCDVVLKRVAGDAAAAGRAAWVHTLIHRARSHGVRELATPLSTPAGATLVADTGGGVWELVPFMTGRPLERPSTVEVARAMDVIARLHQAWGSDAGDRRHPLLPPRSSVGSSRRGRSRACHGRCVATAVCRSCRPSRAVPMPWRRSWLTSWRRGSVRS